jgi:hypothetical protein
MTDDWIACRYCPARGHVEWMHCEVDADTRTCYHHARTHGAQMVHAGWARVTEAEWLEEPDRLREPEPA